MYKLFWELFKKTGSIEAYMYLYDHRVLIDGALKLEKLDKNGNSKYPGNCT